MTLDWNKFFAWLLTASLLLTVTAASWASVPQCHGHDLLGYQSMDAASPCHHDATVHHMDAPCCDEDIASDHCSCSDCQCHASSLASPAIPDFPPIFSLKINRLRPSHDLFVSKTGRTSRLLRPPLIVGAA